MTPRLVLAALALAGASSAPAGADCRWEWLCNGEGACKHMPVCDSVDERPPPRPESRPPVVPPLSMRPFRPAGQGRAETVCEHIMRQGRNGRWAWTQACYCVDREKNPDASYPFANIVRCDELHR